MSRAAARPVVLHAVSRFLPRSETFVYTVVTGHKDFQSRVLCHGVENAAEFPFQPLHALPVPETKWSAHWWGAAAVNVATGRSPWRRRVEALIAETAPDIIHAHFGPVGCELAAVAKATGVPLVTSLYGVDAAVLPYMPRWRAAYQQLFRDGSLFLGEGPEMCKKIVAAGAPAARTLLQPIAVDLRRYPGWQPGDDCSVLFVGRFIEKKGLLDAIATVAVARASLPRVRLTVVGAGPDETAARESVRRHGLSDAVEFVGMKPHREVIEQLARSSVLLHPSATAADGDSEGGAPTIVLEAQAIGTPVVTTRHADIPYVAPEGPGVFLCPEHDIDALAQGLVTALTARRRSGGSHLADRHDVSIALARLESHYRFAITSSATAVAV